MAVAPSGSERCYVGGTFDLLHVGHVQLLEAAAALGKVWVALNTDEFAARYKRKPIVPLPQRMIVVMACRYVEGVIVNRGDEDSRNSIEWVEPRYIVHGDDWTGEEYLKQLGVTAEWLAERKIELRYPPYTQGVSTTGIIEQMTA